VRSLGVFGVCGAIGDDLDVLQFVEKKVSLSLHAHFQVLCDCVSLGRGLRSLGWVGRLLGRIAGEGLEPLEEFEIVLKFSADEFVDVDVFFDVAVVEGLLQDLVVGERLVLVFGLGVDSFQVDFAGIEGGDYSAVHSSIGAVFDFTDGR
jgi:hypothetical protein